MLWNKRTVQVLYVYVDKQSQCILHLVMFKFVNFYSCDCYNWYVRATSLCIGEDDSVWVSIQCCVEHCSVENYVFTEGHFAKPTFCFENQKDAVPSVLLQPFHSCPRCTHFHVKIQLCLLTCVCVKIVFVSHADVIKTPLYPELRWKCVLCAYSACLSVAAIVSNQTLNTIYGGWLKNWVELYTFIHRHKV